MQALSIQSWILFGSRVLGKQVAAVKAMAQPAARGGARGQKVAEIELEHLTDSLKGLVKSHGAETVFQFKGYFNVTKPMAVNGLALKCHVEFVEALSQVNEKLEFKFSDLKEGFSETLKAFPHRIFL